MSFKFPFPSGFTTKTLYELLLSPYVQHAPPISFFLIWSPETLVVRLEEPKAYRRLVFSTSLLPRPSSTKISKSWDVPLLEIIHKYYKEDKIKKCGITWNGSAH
jgi:hypothetical protein